MLTKRTGLLRKGRLMTIPVHCRQCGRKVRDSRRREPHALCNKCKT